MRRQRVGCVVQQRNYVRVPSEPLQRLQLSMRVLHLLLALADQLLQRVGRVGTLSGRRTARILSEEDDAEGALRELLHDANFGVAHMYDSVGGEISAGVRVHRIGDVGHGFHSHRGEVEERSLHSK